MLLRNSIYYFILFLFTLLFSMGYYLHKEYSYRVDKRNEFSFNPIIEKTHYKKLEKNKYIDLKNKDTFILENNDIYENSDKINKLISEDIDGDLKIINNSDYCVMELKDGFLILDECSNQILRIKVLKSIDKINEKNLLYQEENKKIKFYFKYSN